MATAYKISLTFLNTEGKSVTFSYKYANVNCTKERITALMDTMIANKDIFKSKPAEKKSAKLVATEETPYEI